MTDKPIMPQYRHPKYTDDSDGLPCLRIRQHITREPDGTWRMAYPARGITVGEIEFDDGVVQPSIRMDASDLRVSFTWLPFASDLRSLAAWASETAAKMEAEAAEAASAAIAKAMKGGG